MAELDDQLRKIQALVDKAHGGTTDAEKAALLAKADELMMKYSLGADMLLDPNRTNIARPVYDTKPEVRDFTIVEQAPGTEFDYHLRSAMSSLFYAVADHLFVRVGYSPSPGAVKLVGYPVDLRFLEMFFLKLKMHMLSEMLAEIDPEKPWQEAMAGLKNMGHKWERVHEKLGGLPEIHWHDPSTPVVGHPDYPYHGQRWQRKFGVRFTNEMKKLVMANPEMARNKSSNPAAWRADYVDGYVDQVRTRLRQMRNETILNNPNVPALVADKKSQVEEAFYEEFPNLRPHPPTCECETCHYIKCNDKTCNRPRCVEARKPVRTSGRVHYRRWNADAAVAGRKAGARADLSDKGPIG